MGKRKCVLCESTGLKEVFRVENAPLYAQKVLSGAEKKLAGKKTVLLYKCQDCDMTQLDVNDLSQKGYFDDYLVSRSATELCTSYENRLITAFVSRFNLYSKHVVEIGCGDGYSSERLIKEGVKVSAIEPSRTACELARKRGVTCYNVYLDASIGVHVKEQFDGFVAKQVLDLIKEPNVFLQSLGKILKPGAFGLIDVPSLTKTLSERRYYDILSDRVSYFTAFTLTRMLEKNNFHVIDVVHDANDEYLVSYVCYEGSKDMLFHRFNNDFQEFKKQFLGLIGELFAKNKTITAWGAGAKGTTLLSFCGVDSSTVKYVIDKDPSKWNSYLSGSLIKIVPADILDKEKQPDAIIITAAMYYKEILAELVERYNYKGDIILLSPYPHVISNDQLAATLKTQQGATNECSVKGQYRQMGQKL